MLRHRPGPLALLAAAAILPGAVLETFGGATVPVGGTGHFAIAVGVALVAGLASAGLTATAMRRRDAQTALLGTAFSTMTALLGVHGFATPGVVVGPNGVVALAGGLSLPAGAAVLALTALPAVRRTRRMAGLLVLQGTLAAAVIGLGAAGLLWPTLVPAVPESASGEALALMAAGVALFGLLANRALRTYALTRRAADLAVAVGCAWLALASIATLTRIPGSAGFYLGHVLELSGVLMLGIPVALDLRRCAASRPLVGDLSAAEVVAAEEAYLGTRVRVLMVRLAEHDGSTEGHARRVALLAVQVGEALGLPAATLRHLAVGGLLHDIGKLSVAGAILRKPGALGDDEYAEVKRHPDAGVRLLRELGGFAAAVHSLVGEHHERLDGGGYPRGLTAPDLAIGPRILAVCDVYDALVSDRVYREAWTPERALALLRAEAGAAFDPACVESLAVVVGLAPVAAPAVAPAAARGVAAHGAPAIRTA
jgi:HD-GYP domain-containing protein (c-di-GMP phosphodiesterase class II)